MLLMSKGSKEALTVLIITHVTYVKGSKEALTVSIGTHVTHVKGVKRSLNSFTHNFPTIPSNAMYVEGVESYFDF